MKPESIRKLTAKTKAGEYDEFGVGVGCTGAMSERLG